MFLPQLDSIATTNSPLPIIFVFFWFSLWRDARQSSPVIEKIAKLLSEGLIWTSLCTRPGLGTHSDQNLAAFSRFLESQVLCWTRPLLRSLHQLLAATAPAFIERCGERKWHHPGTDYYSCTCSYLGGCGAWSTSVRCLSCTLILRF